MTWIDLYGQVNDVMAIFTDPYISLIWTVAPLFPAAAQKPYP